MIKSLKYLLAALIIAGLPLRGYAAATMQVCDATGHGGLVPEGVHAVHAHTHDVEVSQHGEPKTSPGSDHHDSHGVSTCSACGACCLGASAPSSIPVVPAIKAASPIAALAAQGFSGVVLKSPERPPLPLVR